MNSDSAVPGLNRNIALSTKVLIPPKSKIGEFDQNVASFFSKIHTNQSQIRTLENLRDILLPKLISGEVRTKITTFKQIE